jgi:hypothetical protein
MTMMRLVASNHNGTTLLVLYIPLVFDGIKVTVLFGVMSGNYSIVIHCSLHYHRGLRKYHHRMR